MEMMIVIFGVLIAMILMGVPIAFSIAISSLVTIFFFDLGVPMTVFAAKCYSGMDSFTLMAIPFFIFAGNLMNKAGLTLRIVDFAQALVGALKGGLTYVNVVAAMLMAGISGSGTADAAALTTIMVPAMEKKGYSRSFAVALTSAANTVGPIIPPSTLFILFSFYTNVSIAKLFLGGILPGILMGGVVMVVGRYICVKKKLSQGREGFSLRKLWTTFRKALAALLAPVLIMVAILGGFATASEVGVLVCAFAIILGLIYRTIRSFKDIFEVVLETLQSTVVVFALLSFSGIFANLLVRSQFQKSITELLLAIADTPITIMFVIALFLLILGMFIDATPLIIMFSAAFYSVAVAFGIDPVAFGVIFIVVNMLGTITPPVGGLLFVACSAGKIKITEVIPNLLPLLAGLVIIVAILIIFPAIITFIPNLAGI